LKIPAENLNDFPITDSPKLYFIDADKYIPPPSSTYTDHAFIASSSSELLPFSDDSDENSEIQEFWKTSNEWSEDTEKNCRSILHDSTSSDEDNENLLEKIEELTNLKKRMSAQAKDLIRKLIKKQFFS
jgi:hypothetical protein